MTLKNKTLQQPVGKSGEIKETIQVCIHLSAVLCLALSGLMLQELHVAVTLSKPSIRPAESSKQKSLYCTECCIYGMKLPEIPREQKLCFVHLDEFPSAISNDLNPLHQGILEKGGGCAGTTSPLKKNKLLPARNYMECCYTAALYQVWRTPSLI